MSSSSRIVSWFAWFLAVTFFAYQFVLRVSPGVIMQDIMQKFHINATSFGVLSAAYYFGYSGMQIPVGILLDKYGPRFVIAICAMICVIGNLSFIYSEHWAYALIGRFLIGFGSAAGFLGTAKTIRMYFKEEHFTHMVGITFTLGLLGALYGGKPISMLNAKFGWQTVLLVLSGAGFAIAVLILLLFRNVSNNEVIKDDTPIWRGVIDVLKQPKILWIGFCGALLVGPMECFADIWGVSYLTTVYGIDRSDASMITSAIYFGMCFGGPILAFFAERFHSHYITTALSGLVMALIFALMIFKGGFNVSKLSILMFIVGILCCYQVLVFSIVDGMVPANLSGIVISVTNMMIMAIGSLFHFVIGFVMDFYWDGKLSEEGLRLYNTEAYSNSLLIIPATLMLGFIGFLILRPKKTAIQAAVAK
jgi:predicted MFS family arabinose efflux permease